MGARDSLGMPLIKSLLMLFNVGFWVSGLAIIWAGIWMQIDMQSYLKISTEYSNTAPYILLGTGILILFVSTLACSCTVKGQPSLLYLYGGFLIIILFVELALAASIYAYKDRLAEGFDQGLRQNIRGYDANAKNVSNIDIIQKKLKCCGITSYKDWYEMSPGKQIPKSCCINPEVCGAQDNIDVYEHGCYKKLINILNSNMGTIGVIASGLAFFPIIGTILSCFLASNVKKCKYEQVE